MTLSRPRLRVDLDALAQNHGFFRDLCGTAELGAAVKANAYGLGLEIISRTLHDLGCRSFFVAHANEGAQLRRLELANVDIHVLHGPSAPEMGIYMDHALRPVLNTPAQVELWRSKGNGRACSLHFDTGITRLGLNAASSEEYAQLEGLELVMSHLACSDPAHPMNREQLNRFREICHHFPNTQQSLSGSAGCLYGEEYLFDLARPGIGLYGGNPVDGIGPELAPVAEIFAPVLDVKHVRAGDSIGYGADFIAKQSMQVAVLAYGYADGLLRSACPAGFGRFQGQKARLVGRVSMDMCVVDVTDMTNPPVPGDFVQFLGKDLDAFAKTCSTVSYELLTGIGPRVVRDSTGKNA